MQRLSLKGWTPSSPLPDAATKPALLQCQAWVDRALAPATPEMWARVSDRLTVFTMAFNIATPNLVAAINLYKLAMADLPADLLASAFNSTIKSWKWHNAMPTPAEILAHVSEEMGERKRFQATLNQALRRADLEAQDRDQARREAQDRAWWEAKAKARGITIEEMKAEAAAAVARVRAGGSALAPKPPAEDGAQAPVSGTTTAVQNALKDLASRTPAADTPDSGAMIATPPPL